MVSVNNEQCRSSSPRYDRRNFNSLYATTNGAFLQVHDQGGEILRIHDNDNRRRVETLPAEYTAASTMGSWLLF